MSSLVVAWLVFTRHSYVMAANHGATLGFVLTSSLDGSRPATDSQLQSLGPQVMTGSQVHLINLSCFILAIQPQHRLHEKYHFQQFFYCCVSVAADMCLLIHCLTMVISSGSTTVFRVSYHNTDPNRVYRLLPNNDIFFGESNPIILIQGPVVKPDGF
jgi:hypothetical protein